MKSFLIFFTILFYLKIGIYCDSNTFCGSDFLPKKDPKKLLTLLK